MLTAVAWKTQIITHRKQLPPRIITQRKYHTSYNCIIHQYIFTCLTYTIIYVYGHITARVKKREREMVRIGCQLLLFIHITHANTHSMYINKVFNYLFEFRSLEILLQIQICMKMLIENAFVMGHCSYIQRLICSIRGLACRLMKYGLKPLYITYTQGSETSDARLR